MLTKLLPEQVAKFWDVISYALDQAPPINLVSPGDWKNRLLVSIESGRVNVWASYKKQDEKTKFEGLAFTTILTDQIFMANSLLIYYIYTYEKATARSYIEALYTLAKYARSKRCYNILAYSNEPKVVEVCGRLGADISTSLITFNIESCLNNLINFVKELS